MRSVDRETMGGAEDHISAFLFEAKAVEMSCDLLRKRRRTPHYDLAQIETGC